MVDQSLNSRAQQLRSLHDSPPLVLPNAWDAASAALIAQAGAAAVATTSGGVAWSLGRTDRHGLSRSEMANAVGRIVAAVDVPVTADVEGGYGPGPADVRATVEAVLAAGAVGINLEDSRSVGQALFSITDQADRIRAARVAAVAAGVPGLFVNARTDVFLHEVGDPVGRLVDVQARVAAYAEAGADCVFIPGVLDLDVLKTVVASSPLPVNAMAQPGGPTVAELAGVGVQRISVGTAITQVAYSAAYQAAVDMLATGAFEGCASSLGFAALDHLFAPARP